MAIYEYQCSECSAVLELNKKIADRDLVSEDTCPECQSVGTLNRLVAAPTLGYMTTTGASSRPPDGFREVLRNIHKRAPGSQLDKTSSFI